MNSFQQTSGEQGRLFEDSCEKALIYARFELSGVRTTLKTIGVEVDFIATNQHDISFYITAKGSMRGVRPGARRTDTLKKALCDAFLLAQAGLGPVLLFTSHIPQNGSGLAMLRSMDRNILFDVLNPWTHDKRLQWLAKAKEEELRKDMQAPLINLIVNQWGICDPLRPVSHTLPGV